MTCVCLPHYALLSVSVSCSICFLLQSFFFWEGTFIPLTQRSVGSMSLQFLEIRSHIENHAIEWHDFERDTQFHGVVVA